MFVIYNRYIVPMQNLYLFVGSDSGFKLDLNWTAYHINTVNYFHCSFIDRTEIFLFLTIHVLESIRARGTFGKN